MNKDKFLSLYPSEDKILFENWSEINATLLVNFLRMPEENQIHLLKSIFERKPDLLQLLIKESRNNLIQNLLEK
jgi:hypothetical protein